MHFSTRSMSFVTVASLGATTPRLTLGLLRSIQRHHCQGNKNHHSNSNQYTTPSTATRHYFTSDAANADVGTFTAPAESKVGSDSTDSDECTRVQQTCVISAALAFLEGKKRIVDNLSAAEYSAVDKSVGASIGGHLRHTLDHFSKCLAALQTPSSVPSTKDHQQQQQIARAKGDFAQQQTNVNDEIGWSMTETVRYDHRVRGGTVETDPSEAARVIASLQALLEGLSRGGEGSILLRKTPVSPAFLLGEGGGGEHAFESNLERELFFCCHHGFHHDAMIRLILARMQSTSDGARALLGEKEGKCGNLGVAPSTAGFRKEQAKLQEQEEELKETTAKGSNNED